VDEEQHILRYWEKEFSALNPKKNRSGNRIYAEKDINIVKAIKILLRGHMLSLKGAKEQLKQLVKNNRIIEFIEEYEAQKEKQSNFKEKPGGDTTVKISKKVLEEITETLRESLDYLKSI
jgi:DNA-binding transcriptional MerR regulator